jgi:hypothetical protein
MLDGQEGAGNNGRILSLLPGLSGDLTPVGAGSSQIPSA